VLTIVLQLAAPGAFQLQLSLALLTGVVLGGLGSLFGAIWGAALLVLLPMWSTDIAHSFSFSMKVSSNLPLAIYGVVLIVAMLVWPNGIQGGVRILTARLRGILLNVLNVTSDEASRPSAGGEVSAPQADVTRSPDHEERK
jgi:branched-chain amino acid transport system permease protein